MSGKARTILLLAIILTTVGALVLRQLRREHDQCMTSSCANHINLISFIVHSFNEREERLPSETDTRKVLEAMSQPDDNPPEWLDSYGSACPESFERDGSIGYVFVGDGLSTKIAKEQLALIL